LLVVLLGVPHSPMSALEGFRHLWTFSGSMAVACGLICVLLPGRSVSPVGAA